MPDKTWVGGGVYRMRWATHSDPENLEIMKRRACQHIPRLDFRLVPQPSPGKAAAGME